MADNFYVNFNKFLTKNIGFTSDLLHENCNFIIWKTLNKDYYVDKELYF